MGAKALKVLTIEELDQTFLSILTDQCEWATEEARQCTASIFTLTSHYISQPEFDTLQQFYDLYFVSSADMDQKKNAINEEVDSLVDSLQAAQERGEDLTVGTEDEAKKKERLSLSAVQKKLETLIKFDGGIRDQILPALASMQCEDAVRQRVDHLRNGWRVLVDADHSAMASTPDWDAIAHGIAKTLTSVAETKAFYEKVLGEPAPEGIADQSVFIEF